jgi:hypothetical protein
MHRTLIAIALGASLAGAVRANEYTSYQAIDLTPRGAGGEARCTRMALLNLPAGWQAGDAVVVMIAAVQDTARDQLVAAMLAEQAAVLEVPPAAAPAACLFDRPEAAALAPPADALGLVLGGLAAARQRAGGGLVVAIGHGPAGAVALEATEDGVAADRLGPGGPRFAAGLALGDGPAMFRLGGTPATAERAALRLGLLCDAIARSGVAPGAADAATCVSQLAPETVRSQASQVTLRR